MTQTLSGPMLLPRTPQPRHLMVLLHGYGADGRDLIAVGQHWIQRFPDTLFVAPDAPQPCDINPAGFQWFPLSTDRMLSRVTGADAARDVLVNFLIDLWSQSGLKPADTILLGFSQGAMMALHVGLSLDEPLAGIVAISGALIPPPGLAEGIAPKVPVCVLHGDLDSVVDPKLGQDAAETLQGLGYDVIYHRSAATAHGISEDMLTVAADFVTAQFA